MQAKPSFPQKAYGSSCSFPQCHTLWLGFDHGRNFVVKCGADSLMWNQHNHRADAEVKFCKYRFPTLFFSRVFKATRITPCFITTNDLEINKLNFVVGHGTAIQLGCTTSRLWHKQANLVLSELSVGAHKTVNRTGRKHISLLSRTHQF